MSATSMPPKAAGKLGPTVSAQQSEQLRKAARRRGAVGSTGFHIFALAVLVVILYPAVWMLTSTFKPSNQIVGNVSLIPSDFTLANYATALEGIGGVSFWTFVSNSLILAVASVVGVLISCSLAAYAFARVEFPGRNVFFACMIGTMLLPFHVVVIPQYIVFNNLGMVNTYWPLLIGKFLAADAFFVFLMIQFMRGLPNELDEAARIDGAGHARIFGSIILPLMQPALITSAIFAFIWSWNDFFGPLLYLKNPSMYTMPIALRAYVDQTTTSDYGAQMAMAMLALLPVMLFFFAFQRHLVGGVATQGLKG
ncbi:carbohydrate ABC transporter membrane protein 2 (CUT1 family) [Salana multivorans]|uniref:Carbohydrate ABC transporter membrane protein 2 (CUT1 family) n=2 Tax=Salana multivorans TaxID=120377 RepID=A0A3N2DBT7_9MICO|nr:carbohydrate ABC transporter permease [Salana multivorans]ROR97265.1 carbohydrate ABC transporter membrane protein 2 (CUT1 family) [Salana multivorans]